MAGMRLAWLHSKSDMSDRNTSLPAVVRAATIPPLLALIALNLVIWALTGAGSFWPMWPAWAFLAIMAFRAVWIWGRRSERPGLRVPLAYATVGAVALTVLWGMSGGGYFWPIWPLLGIVIALSVAAMIGRSRHRRARGPGRRADPHPSRRRRRPGLRAAADRARPARRCSGSAGRAVDAARPRRGPARRQGRRRCRPGARAPGSPRGDRGDRRAARPRPRDLAAGAGRPGPGGRRPVARRPRRSAGHGQRRDRYRVRGMAIGRHRRSRTRPTSSSPRR